MLMTLPVASRRQMKVERAGEEDGRLEVDVEVRVPGLRRDGGDGVDEELGGIVDETDGWAERVAAKRHKAFYVLGLGKVRRNCRGDRRRRP